MTIYESQLRGLRFHRSVLPALLNLRHLIDHRHPAGRRTCFWFVGLEPSPVFHQGLIANGQRALNHVPHSTVPKPVPFLRLEKTTWDPTLAVPGLAKRGRSPTWQLGPCPGWRQPATDLLESANENLNCPAILPASPAAIVFAACDSEFEIHGVAVTVVAGNHCRKTERLPNRSQPTKCCRR